MALVTRCGTMIDSFTYKATLLIWNGRRSMDLPLAIQEIARRKLRMLHNAQHLLDLKIPPSNKLEKLKGTLQTFHSKRINKRWRIIFKWIDGNAFSVQIVDYH